MSLIDKDAIAEHLFLSEEYQYGGDGYQDGIKDAIKAINHFPEVDAKPVVQAEWSSLPFKLWQCTRCAKIFEYAYNYCPHCGAEMRGSGDGKE